MKKQDKILLGIILIVAALLRFWNFPNIPFMADELSALSRTHFNTLHDLIYKGARIDGHPIGIQVFLFYWVKLFGEKEWIIKLPFIISGILSVYLSYRIAKFWFSNTTGLITSAFMAGLQYWVMYSQIARPYISGLFFSMLMVWCWTNLLFNSESNKKKWFIGYVISSALCAYDHHFALLFAATVGLSGLFFIKKETWKIYILAGVCIFILYIPHLHIFFYQLSIGGVGEWLGKPKPDWLFTYIKYIFHFSKWIYLLVGILIMISLFYQNENKKHLQQFRILSICWFLLQFLIGYFYSKYVNPVLQYSTLIFVSPFFIMFLFSLFKELKHIYKIIIVTVILFCTTLSLVFERKHYEVFYKQPYEQLVLNTFKTIDKTGDANKCTVELPLNPAFVDYYFNKYHKNFISIYYNDYDRKIEPAKFNKMVSSLSTDYFICGNLPLEYYQIIKQTYPYIFAKEEGFTYSFYCFSKKKPAKELTETIIYSNKNINSNDSSIANINDNVMKEFYMGKGECSLDSNEEFCKAAFSIKMKDIIAGNFSIVNIGVDITTNDTSANPSLVFDLQNGNKSIDWVGSELKIFANNKDKTTRVFLSRMISKNDLRSYPNASLKTYIWNKNKKNIRLSKFSIEVIRSNPYIYGLFEPCYP